MTKLFVRLDDQTFNALRRVARAEYRDFRQQAGLLIKESLEKRGLLEPAIQSKTETNQPAENPPCPEARQ